MTLSPPGQHSARIDAFTALGQSLRLPTPVKTSNRRTPLLIGLSPVIITGVVPQPTSGGGHSALQIKRARWAQDIAYKSGGHVSGHSMRVGAARDLLKRGFDTAAIMRVGGWKSMNVLARYLEKAEHNICA
ncbi:hypothetical protein C0V72_14315 [Porphyrobacter sp. TH134]|uniref:tyrosine-type recombinase/integrase n=1 Tax=Porphyrobacter sp. TH134 TaxID=2067450 RepID=UPI000C7CDF1C|nr:hypothetical protein C0V72_14315 [Porphyrobacter sp. TH134]